MLDIKLIRKDPEWIKNKLASRGVTSDEIDELLHGGSQDTVETA